VPAQAVLFAIVFLACAWALYTRQSLVATLVIAAFLLVELAGLPFYSRSTWVDYVLQFGLGGVVASIGLVAALRVLLEGRRRRASA